MLLRAGYAKCAAYAVGIAISCALHGALILAYFFIMGPTFWGINLVGSGVGGSVGSGMAASVSEVIDGVDGGHDVGRGHDGMVDVYMAELAASGQGKSGAASWRMPDDGVDPLTRKVIKWQIFVAAWLLAMAVPI